MYLQRIENNWRTGRHVLQRIHCRSETSKGVYCLQYDDTKIVSGLRDNTIKVESLSNLSRRSSAVHIRSVIDDKIMVMEGYIMGKFVGFSGKGLDRMLGFFLS